MIGCGSIGQGVLPLLLKHLEIAPSQLLIITADTNGQTVAESYHVEFIINALTSINFKDILKTYLTQGDILLNLSVDVSSLSLVEYCQKNNILYLDTCTEPWAGWYTDETLTLADRSNYNLRKNILSLRSQFNQRNSPTALLTHGANPGLVSHFVKQALINLATDIGITYTKPTTKKDWGMLAKKLDIKVIQIAERDTQESAIQKHKDEFWNTWSIDGLHSEACQPSEIGWGTHEELLPPDGSNFNAQAPVIYIDKPGYSTFVKTYTPTRGETVGYLITHAETISITDYFSLADSNGQIEYRPTVYYAYHPSEATVESLIELAHKGGMLQVKKHLQMDDIVSGYDELGVLLMGHKRGAYWFGSKLTIEEARVHAPHNNATSLQVSASVLAGLLWLLDNQNLGIVEPEDIDYEAIIEIAKPYLGEIFGQYTEWNATDSPQSEWQFSDFIFKSDAAIK